MTSNFDIIYNDFPFFRYCECFAIGWYCAESCACQGCHNKTDYEETVLEKRRVIASRNQLAFAPKIEQHTSQFINRVCDPSN